MRQDFVAVIILFAFTIILVIAVFDVADEIDAETIAELNPPLSVKPSPRFLFAAPIGRQIERKDHGETANSSD